MTEAEWSACEDPARMLHWLGATGAASGRKLRLFACACCRTLTELLVEEGLRAIQVSERYADGQADESQVRTAREAAKRPDMTRGNAMFLRRPSTQGALRAAMLVAWGKADPWRGAVGVFHQVLETRQFSRWRETHGELAALLRDLLGPLPFRVVSLDPIWLARDDRLVPRLAEAIYQEAAFDRLSILADALEDADCTDPIILDHLRGPGPHVKGCWAVDLLTGRG